MAFTAVDNPVLRDVLPSWDSILGSSIVDPALDRAMTLISSRLEVVRISLEAFAGRVVTWLVAAPASPEVLTVVEAVTFIQDRLGLPVTAVSRAGGFSRRTYYSWRDGIVRQPRLASIGSLWALVQITEDLEELLGQDLQRWMLADVSRRTLLEAGRFDEVFASALAECSQDAAKALGPSLAVGDEVALPALTHRRRVPVSAAPRIAVPEGR